SGNNGPAAVVFHSGAINGVVDTKNEPMIYHTKRYLVDQVTLSSKGSISEVIHMLEEAEHPFIIVGDGGFFMSMNGVISAVELNLPIIVVILNNAALGWVKNAQSETKIASEFEDIQFANIAESMRCVGYKELKDVFEKAMKVERPVVIDVKTTDEEPYKKV